jgi:hypothetical protein
LTVAMHRTSESLLLSSPPFPTTDDGNDAKKQRRRTVSKYQIYTWLSLADFNNVVSERRDIDDDDDDDTNRCCFVSRDDDDDDDGFWCLQVVHEDEGGLSDAFKTCLIELLPAKIKDVHQRRVKLCKDDARYFFLHEFKVRRQKDVFYVTQFLKALNVNFKIIRRFNDKDDDDEKQRID